MPAAVYTCPLCRATFASLAPFANHWGHEHTVEERDAWNDAHYRQMRDQQAQIGAQHEKAIEVQDVDFSME